MKTIFLGTTKRVALFGLLTIGIGVSLGIAVDRVALAQQPGITRTILQKADDPGAAGYEAIMGIAEIPAGAMSGKHRHHGTELGFVLSGSVVVEKDGKVAATYKAGDAFKNESDIHNARNTSKDPVKILAVYLVEKGKPLAEPVP